MIDLISVRVRILIFTGSMPILVGDLEGIKRKQVVDFCLFLSCVFPCTFFFAFIAEGIETARKLAFSARGQLEYFSQYRFPYLERSFQTVHWVLLLNL